MWKKFKAWINRRLKKPEEKPQAPEFFSGSWKLSRLIDELPLFHKILRKLSHYKNTNIGSLIRMGPTIIASGDSWLSLTDDYNMWESPPSQFFVSWGSPKEKEDDSVRPTFFAGLKVQRPYNVQVMPGDCYEFLFYYKEFNYWFDGYFYICNRKISLAKSFRTVSHRIHRNGKKPIDVPSIQWDNNLRYLFEQENNLEIDALLLMLFRSVLIWWNERDRRWLVVTKKNNMRVSFSVEEGRHLYFFRDRDKTVTTPTGKRKTIFHICSEHMRTMKSGKKVFIKEHCRGVRHFFWKDCETHIFAPGWHGSDLFKKLDATMIMPDDEDEAPHTVDASQFAEKLARVIEGTNLR